MIVNSENVTLIRQNAQRLAGTVRSKDELAELATAGTFEQFFVAIETLLTNTDMYFDDELLNLIDSSRWQNLKATLMVFTLNLVNRKFSNVQKDSMRVDGLTYAEGRSSLLS
jgi:hypothetical protein